MTIVPLGSVDPGQKKAKPPLKNVPYEKNEKMQSAYSESLGNKKSYQRDEITIPLSFHDWQNEQSDFLLKLNTQNLLVLFLKAKDYHSFSLALMTSSGAYAAMFVLLQTLLGEQ